MSLRLGLPMWGLDDWKYNFYGSEIAAADYLRHYAGVFSAVEGNNSFYGVPSEASISAWQQGLPKNFRFLFKMPKAITHDSKLQQCDLLLKSFFERLMPIKANLGPILIQLSPSFSGADLPILEQFVRKLPAVFSYAIEVRHTDFYQEGEVLKQFETLLRRYRLGRVVFDTRALFASQSTDAATLDAKSKKPNFPLLTAGEQKQMVIRFIGDMDTVNNESYLAYWVEKVAEYLAQGKEVFFMLHMADNALAPQLAREFYQLMRERLPELPDMSLWPIERAANTGQLRLF